MSPNTAGDPHRDSPQRIGHPGLDPDDGLRLQPTVTWPRTMTVGRRHLVEVDLDIVTQDGMPPAVWPFAEEELAYTCVLRGGDDMDLWAVHGPSVAVHRFGGSYGPAEFVVTPGEGPEGRSLWLTIVTPWGVTLGTHELKVLVRATEDELDIVPTADIPASLSDIITWHHPVIVDVIGRSRVLILVVTETERDAVIAAVQAHTGRPPVADSSGERTIYTLGVVGGTEVMLAQASEQGTATAAGMIVVVAACIARARPDYVILTGICYGLRPNEGQWFGDVIVARRVHNVDPRKVTDDDLRPVIRRGVNVGCSPILLDRFQAGQRTWTGSRVHFGTMLSSNTLFNSERVVSELREEFPDALGGEMEGPGVYEAATLGSKPDWIMVKAISDWGYSKTAKKQPLAARNAAQFVVHVISSGALQQRA